MAYLKQTLESVLLQDPGQLFMQIEVVDDGSTDGDVFSLVQEVGKGRVQYYKQEINRGSLRNFETCLNRAKGQWVHLLHGDDKVKPGFYKEIENLFTRFPEAGAAFVNTIQMNEEGEEGYRFAPLLNQPGIIPDWLTKIAQCQLLQAPAIVIKREVYEHLGGYFGVQYGEDWEMYVRIAAHYPVAFSPEYLALYRVHGNNISTRSALNGQNIKDICLVMKLVESYFPEKEKRIIFNKAKMNYSIHFSRVAHDVYRLHNDRLAALKLMHRAIRMDVNPTTILLLLKLYLKCLLGYRSVSRTQ
jgi:glycosyltransferase involved in cell wall biosynthesis